MPQNPFYLGWNKGWSFLFYLEGGTPKIEASGFGIAITTDIKKEESPSQAADRLILKSNEIENLDTILGFVQLNSEMILINLKCFRIFSIRYRWIYD